MDSEESVRVVFGFDRRKPRMGWANAHRIANDHAAECFSIYASAQAEFMRYNNRVEMYWLSRDSMGVCANVLI